MNEPDEAKQRELASAFTAHLNRSGFPFQYSVLGRTEEMFKLGSTSSWGLVAVEFPVEVQGAQARIDFILAQRIISTGYRRLLVGECKRVNPGISRWLFAKAPYLRFQEEPDQVLVERLQYPDPGVDTDGLFAGVGCLHRSPDVYHVAFEARSDEKGESSGAPRGVIEDAATQIMRGVNGLVECISQRPAVLPVNRDVVVVPAIFTTAELWVAKTDIASADLATGRLTVKPEEVERRSWLWYQYHVSPGLRHRVRRYFNRQGRSEWEEGIEPLLDREYARAIAIVSSEGVDKFLTWPHWG